MVRWDCSRWLFWHFGEVQYSIIAVKSISIQFSMRKKLRPNGSPFLTARCCVVLGSERTLASFGYRCKSNYKRCGPSIPEQNHITNPYLRDVTLYGLDIGYCSARIILHHSHSVLVGVLIRYSSLFTHVFALLSLRTASWIAWFVLFTFLHGGNKLESNY